MRDSARFDVHSRGMMRSRSKSKRERAADEVGKLLQEDLVFRENFCKALPGSVGTILAAVLKRSDEKRAEVPHEQ
jgi:hypothetical protein